MSPFFFEGPTVSPKKQSSSLNDFADGIDLSPIKRSGLKVPLRGKSRTLPISTSTPMPGIPSPKAQRKRPREESTPLPTTDDLAKSPSRKKAVNAGKLRTRSQLATTPSGSPAKVKTASKPPSPPRLTRSGRSRGKGQ
ncbi:hypothetical protein COOONC_25132 [Cooperia oncophora]